MNRRHERRAPQQLATPDEIYDYPANRFVAEFIGSPPMNLLPAEIVYGEIVALGVWRIPYQSSVATGTVDLGLRPESLILGGERGYPTEVFLVELHARPEIGSTVLMNAESEGIRLFDRTNGKALNA